MSPEERELYLLHLREEARMALNRELSDQDLEYIAAGKSLTIGPRPRQPVYGNRNSTRGTASASPTPAAPASSGGGSC